MTLLRGDLLDNAAFIARRKPLETEAIANAAARRVRLGAHLTFLFENRVSVRWQVQEMCRVENIVAPAAVQHELDTYNALLPSLSPDGSAELSATLLIEYRDEAERDLALRALVGLQSHVFLRVAGVDHPARLDGEQYNADRVSAVQFVRFPIRAEAWRAFTTLAGPVALVCTHPAHAAEVALGAAFRGAILEDLG